MSDSRLIELSYFAPNAKTRLTPYADTIMIDRDGKDSVITAIRFGGYPEMVRAMSDAIYGGGTIEAKRNGLTRMLKSTPKRYRRQLAHDGIYVSATLAELEISLYDVVKTTGERKDVFKFSYGGRRYDRLSLSEKVRAGMKVSELMKRLTGRNYPVLVDNMESVDDLANVQPTGQVIIAKCVNGTPLAVRSVKPIPVAEQQAA